MQAVKNIFSRSSKNVVEQASANEMALRDRCTKRKLAGNSLTAECASLEAENEARKERGRSRYCSEAANKNSSECVAKRLDDEEKAHRSVCEATGDTTPACVAVKRDIRGDGNPCWSKNHSRLGGDGCSKCKQSIDKDFQCMAPCITSRRRCNRWARYAGAKVAREAYCSQHRQIAIRENEKLKEMFLKTCSRSR